MRFAPSMPSAFSTSALIFGPVVGSSSRATNSLFVPSRYLEGTSVARSDVELAMYGYWSAVTSAPFLRAVSISPTARPLVPHAALPLALMCEMWTRQPDSLPMVIASSMASSSAPDSLRMWLAYMPPCRFATFASATISSVFAYVPGL